MWFFAFENRKVFHPGKQKVIFLKIGHNYLNLGPQQPKISKFRQIILLATSQNMTFVDFVCLIDFLVSKLNFHCRFLLRTKLNFDFCHFLFLNLLHFRPKMLRFDHFRNLSSNKKVVEVVLTPYQSNFWFLYWLKPFFAQILFDYRQLCIGCWFVFPYFACKPQIKFVKFPMCHISRSGE